jgi:DNA polymerase/3'-5' exonuclease PolX
MYLLKEAEAKAQWLVEQMRPFCVRAEIAGSIRRRKAEVKDIEIVAIPKFEDRQQEGFLFAKTKSVNLLYELWARDIQDVQWIKPATQQIVSWPVNADGRYWRGLLPSGMKLDLFLVCRENWGLQLLIRTGCAEFSQAVMTEAKRIGKPCVNAFLQSPSGESIPTFEEQDVFEALGLEYVEPPNRTGPAAIHRRSFVL